MPNPRQTPEQITVDEPAADIGSRFNFTTERLRNLPARASRYEVRDTEVNGLVLRVTPAGVRSFSVVAWVPARQRPERVTLGRFPTVSIDTARKRARQIVGTIAEGRSPAAERNAVREEDTFEAAFNAYVEQHAKAKLKAKQQKEVAQLYDNWLVPAKVHTKRLRDFKFADLETLHVRIGKGHKHPRAANKVVALVRAVYKHAAKRGAHGIANPATGIEQFHIASRTRFLQADEMQRFFAALDDTAQPEQDMVRLMLATGVRLGNLLAARFDQFDLVGDNPTWTIQGSETKNKQMHVIPLQAETVDLVQRRRKLAPRGSPWLWPSSRSRSGHVETIDAEWRALLDRAGIDNLRRHDIRRTVGSWLAINGANMPVIGRALGHSSIYATQVYARLTLDPVRQAMQGAADAMQRAAKPPARKRLPR